MCPPEGDLLRIVDIAPQVCSINIEIIENSFSQLLTEDLKKSVSGSSANFPATPN